jgi:predicted NAD/FAD-binding protein
MRVAVVGAGIAGLGAAWLLRKVARVTLFEAEPRLGGHADTVEVRFGDRVVPVDTGFIVLNDRTYPNLLGLFAELGVALEPTDMGFGVSVANGRLEYAGGTIPQLFAQKRNLFRPAFHAMWRDILRFYREAPRVLRDDAAADEPLGDWLTRHRYGDAFIRDHLLPMGAAIWSASVDGMRAFPVRGFVRFFANHGLLQVNGRPRWRTVTGGSREYVRRIAAALPDVRLAAPVRTVTRTGPGVRLVTDAGAEEFDHAILATHAPQALWMLADATDDERRLLAQFRTQANRAVLHTDAALMPRRRAVWSAWNYLSDGAHDHGGKVSVTYWMNRLQNLQTPEPLLVSLNPLREPDPRRTLREVTYHHPQFDARTLPAQAALAAVQGANRVHFCGAWTRWGFHEDGLASAVAAARALGAVIPWETAAAARAA